ncbi:hypothetical protein [Vibrio rhodolitus]|uniref:hypothetical protein n=1 Tax=Vibrio rhodolitus TaxID=2231649 RepID=UPI000E0AF76E|nr:hypothetical protein [Vibrio rhodolitus]
MHNTDLEFEHLMLEISAQRWHMLERFLFSYFCMRENYLSKAGAPDWQIAREHCPRSTQVSSTKHAELEPIVPLSAIIGELKRYERDGELSRQTVKRILDSLLHYVVISKDEKQRLKDRALYDAMPKEWYRSRDKDPYSRLAKVSIHISL